MLFFKKFYLTIGKKKPKKPGKEKGNKQQKSPNPQGCVFVCVCF